MVVPAHLHGGFSGGVLDVYFTVGLLSVKCCPGENVSQVCGGFAENWKEQLPAQLPRLLRDVGCRLHISVTP